MKTKNIHTHIKTIVFLLFGWVALTTTLHGQTISTWIGGDDATYAWENATHWSNAPVGGGYPNNGNEGVPNYRAVIGDSTGARVIETAGAITLQSLSVTSSESAIGSTTLSIGGNMTVTGTTAAPSGFNNAGEDASTLVFDLNGYNFSLQAAAAAASQFTSGSNYTIMNSGAGPSRLSTPLIQTASNVHIDGNITVRLSSASQQTLSGFVWSSNSTLQLANAVVSGNRNVILGDSVVGNLVVGDLSTTSATSVNFTSPSSRVARHVSVLTYTGAAEGEGSFFNLNNNSLFVGGNFTDTNSDNQFYGHGTILLNGGAVVERALSIGRQMLENNFHVGESDTLAGNAVLGQSLTTTGDFRVRTNSRFNAASFALTSNNLIIDENATIALDFGSSFGSLISLGDLALNSFILELHYDFSGWIDGDDLLLFSYEGDLNGSPFLTNLVAPLVTGYGALYIDSTAKEIYLTDIIVVPEPKTALLLLGSVVWLFASRKLRPKIGYSSERMS